MSEYTHVLLYTILKFLQVYYVHINTLTRLVDVNYALPQNYD